MFKLGSSRSVIRLLLIAVVLFITASLAATTTAQTPTGLSAPNGMGALTTDTDGEHAELVRQQQATRVNIYMIALGDNGRNGKLIGCGDSVVPVRVAVIPTNLPMRAAYNQLFAVTTSTYAGRFNALNASTLSAGRLSISGGRATVELFGAISLAGVCDIPRVIAQIQETALQFPSVRTVTVLVNGVRIEDALSQR